ncbi:hypothetical protein CDL15_Pgr023213 [Punica granatum]|uniref:Uncharacterized protein n=1 Tax=Punica granatum TaxID=22663 RepID=A0A218X5M3_PUNGR|nr:hypothetical protein CDL15_Pgr023213 [Punica granatum]
MTRSTSCGAYSRYKVVASPQYWNETRLGVGAEMATASQQAKGYVQALQLQRIRTNNLDISQSATERLAASPATCMSTRKNQVVPR